MIPKSFEAISKADIDALVANAVPEVKTIEYKEGLPGNTDTDKKEFLKDASSFANASGGDIIYGMQEKRDAAGKPTGIPEVANGLAGINIDQEIVRLDNMLRTGIAPRINGLQIKPVNGFPNGSVLVIRIPKSWAAPHMVTFQSESRFFSRTNVGKHPLDVAEIRSAFALSDSLPEKVRRFRDERLARIVADETPVPIQQGARAILHLLPISALDSSSQPNLGIIYKRPALLRLLHGGGVDHRYNFDGYLAFDARPPQVSRSYLQVFRSGAIEAVDTDIVDTGDNQKLIPSAVFEAALVDQLHHYLALLMELSVSTPIFVMLAILGVKGYRMAGRRPELIVGQISPIDRDSLLLPEILVEAFDIDTSQILKPTFDAVWQAAGWTGSPNYQDGRWLRRNG
jgi:hypothetical protein